MNIQCCAISEFTDPRTEITYTSDYYLLNGVGACTNFSGLSIRDLSSRSARIFGNDHRVRWCFDLPVVEGQDYLVRSTFLNGPFLRSMRGTMFNMSIGATSISLINSSLDSEAVEGVFAATGNHTNICILKGNGNAYISKVELRPINDSIYLNGSSSSILKLISRVDLGNKDFTFRYLYNLLHFSFQSSIFLFPVRY